MENSCRDCVYWTSFVDYYEDEEESFEDGVCGLKDDFMSYLDTCDSFEYNEQL